MTTLFSFHDTFMATGIRDGLIFWFWLKRDTPFDLADVTDDDGGGLLSEVQGSRSSRSWGRSPRCLPDFGKFQDFPFLSMGQRWLTIGFGWDI
jgi:hypothetical protein